MTIKPLAGVAVAAAIGLASTPSARAAVVTQTETFGSVVAMFNDHFFLEPFDTSLGTLTGVAITVTLTGTISLEPSHLRTSFSYTNATAGAVAQMNGPDNIEMQTILATPFATGSFAPGDSPVVASASGPVSNTLNVPASDFGAFEIPSPDLVTITIDGFGYFAAITSGSFEAVGDVPGSLDLVYTYTPVGAPIPEPSCALLLTAGLGALCFLSLRRQELFHS